MNELREEDRLRQLIELGPGLVSELDLETLLHRVLATGCSVTGARYAALGILDAERRELERFVTRGLSEEQEQAIGHRPQGRGVLGLLIEEPRPVRIDDVNAHPISFGFPAGHPTMRTFLGVPIVIRGRAWGNLYLTEKEEGEFTEGDERAAVTLAAWAAIAIEHSRLLAAASDRQAELEQAVRRLEATSAVAVSVGADNELSEVLELIAKRGRAVARARTLLILLREGDELVIASAAGHAHTQIGARIPISESTSGQVMLSRRPTRIDDPGAQLRFSPERLGVPGARSALMVPLMYRGESLGVMAAFDRGSGSPGFSDEDELVLVAFAASAGTAVATAQTVQADRLRHSLEAAEAERKHWARELHDETLQALGGLKMLASAARRSGDPDRMTTALEQLRSGLEQQIESVHSIISELRPAALDDLGLRPAIEALAERHAAVHGSEVLCELDIPDPAERGRRLAPELETTAYRLIQEALTNAAKHAEASKVEIHVSASDGRLMLEVADDGRGFDASAAYAGFGLAGMRERVALAGGAIEIHSGSEGTAVRVSLPARDLAAPRVDSHGSEVGGGRLD
jgi:signal transduction histidine kinase